MDQLRERIDDIIERFKFWEAVEQNPDLYEGDFPEDLEWETLSQKELNDEISLMAYYNMKSIRLEYYEVTGESIETED
ncbi:MAG: hypothetical protein VW683_16490 [Betaproteobacteria bacterium]